MKIFILEWQVDIYEPGHILGTFSSQELAEAARDAPRSGYYGGTYSITDWDLDRVYD